MLYGAEGGREAGWGLGSNYFGEGDVSSGLNDVVAITARGYLSMALKSDGTAHANHLSDDWSSTVYWYQLLPTDKPMILQLVEERLPLHKHFDAVPEAPKAALTT